jgi:hypothetical protein
MKLWLDNNRPPPASGGWTWVKTIDEAKRYLVAKVVTEASLDHDLDTPTSGGDLVAWMGETGHWPTHAPKVHSGNVDAAKTMKAAIADTCPSPPPPITKAKVPTRLATGGSTRYSPGSKRSTLY